MNDIDYDHSGYDYSIFVTDSYGIPRDIFIAMNTFSPSQTWTNGYDILVKASLGDNSGTSVFANGNCNIAWNGMIYSSGSTDIRNDVFDATWGE